MPHKKSTDVSEALPIFKTEILERFDNIDNSIKNISDQISEMKKLAEGAIKEAQSAKTLAGENENSIKKNEEIINGNKNTIAYLD